MQSFLIWCLSICGPGFFLLGFLAVISAAMMDPSPFKDKVCLGLTYAFLLVAMLLLGLTGALELMGVSIKTIHFN